MAYFDWNATAPLHPEAKAAWLEAVERFWGNPSTAYRLGSRARLALDEARETVASCLQVSPESIVFTSGATEANNGLIRECAMRAQPDGEVWISSVEHPCVRAAAYRFWGADRVVELPVDGKGRVDLNVFLDRLDKVRPSLVSVMAANNETGVLQPWEEIRDSCREGGVAFHCDASQWIGKEDRADWSGCAAVSFSGHKFGGGRGVGALVLSPEWRSLRLLEGGAQEMNIRAGTENVPGIVAMAAALRYRFESALPSNPSAPRDRFEEHVLAAFPAGQLQIHGRGVPRLWNTSSLALPGYPSERWIMQLDRRGFKVSSGSACATGKDGPSPVLQAMGVTPETMRRTLRISSGWETSADEWEALQAAIMEVYRHLSEPVKASGPGRVIDL